MSWLRCVVALFLLWWHGLACCLLLCIVLRLFADWVLYVANSFLLFGAFCYVSFVVDGWLFVVVCCCWLFLVVVWCLLLFVVCGRLVCLRVVC